MRSTFITYLLAAILLVGNVAAVPVAGSPNPESLSDTQDHAGDWKRDPQYRTSDWKRDPQYRSSDWKRDPQYRSSDWKRDPQYRSSDWKREPELDTRVEA